MHIPIGRIGHFEIDDVRDAFDVEPAGGDVGGDQDGMLARSEPSTAAALALRVIGMERHRDPPRLEVPRDVIGADLHPDEDQDRAIRIAPDEPGEPVDLFPSPDLVHRVVVWAPPCLPTCTQRRPQHVLAIR